jgi:hypothetical protein
LPDPEQTFHTIGASLPQATASQMFGKKCYKIAGKAFVCFFQDCMVFKLSATDHAIAIGLPGARLFDPSGKGRPMKEWVQLPYVSHSEWDGFARSALAYCTQA